MSLRTLLFGRKGRKKKPARASAQRLQYTPLGPKFVSVGYGASGYRSAKIARTSGLPLAQGGSADLHIRYDLDDMRAQSQAFDRDNGLYHGLMNRACDCILGSGFTLQARTSDENTNQRLERLWRQFWIRPEVRQMHEGAAIERMLLRHRLVDGGIGIVKVGKSGLIQLVEGERIDSLKSTSENNNRIERGVELDSQGKPLRFHLSDYDTNGLLRMTARSIPAADFIYYATLTRISQTRGVPAQQCNFSTFHRINDVCDSEAVAWQLLSRLAFVINRRDAAATAATTSEADESPGDADLATRYHDFGEGIIFHGEEGEDIKPVDRGIPGANFPDSITMYLRLLGLPLGFPLELVLLDWSKTNYSSARAALKQAERMFKTHQRLQAFGAMTPIYKWKVARWVGAGLLPALDDIFDHEWHAPPYPFVDPHKEELARMFRYRAGVTSPTREAKESGTDLVELIAEQERDLDLIAQAVERFNAKHPQHTLDVADFTGFVGGSKPPSAKG